MPIVQVGRSNPLSRISKIENGLTLHRFHRGFWSKSFDCRLFSGGESSFLSEGLFVSVGFVCSFRTYICPCGQFQTLQLITERKNDLFEPFSRRLVDGSGLLDLRARRYNAGMGVFASLDPMETRNRYAYVNGNPINKTDPSGLTPCDNGSCYSPAGEVVGEDTVGWQGYDETTSENGSTIYLSTTRPFGIQEPLPSTEITEVVTIEVNSGSPNSQIINVAFNGHEVTYDAIERQFNAQILGVYDTNGRPIWSIGLNSGTPLPDLGNSGSSTQTSPSTLSLPELVRKAIPNTLLLPETALCGCQAEVKEKVAEATDTPEGECFDERTGAYWKNEVFITEATPFQMLQNKALSLKGVFPEVSGPEGLYSIQPSVNKRAVECIATGMRNGFFDYMVDAPPVIGLERGNKNEIVINNGNHRFMASVLTGIKIFNYTVWNFNGSPRERANARYMYWDNTIQNIPNS